MCGPSDAKVGWLPSQLANWFVSNQRRDFIRQSWNYKKNILYYIFRFVSAVEFHVGYTFHRIVSIPMLRRLYSKCDILTPQWQRTRIRYKFNAKRRQSLRLSNRDIEKTCDFLLPKAHLSLPLSTYSVHVFIGSIGVVCYSLENNLESVNSKRYFNLNLK